MAKLAPTSRPAPSGQRGAGGALRTVGKKPLGSRAQGLTRTPRPRAPTRSRGSPPQLSLPASHLLARQRCELLLGQARSGLDLAEPGLWSFPLLDPQGSWPRPSSPLDLACRPGFSLGPASSWLVRAPSSGSDAIPPPPAPATGLQQPLDAPGHEPPPTHFGADPTSWVSGSGGYKREPCATQELLNKI